MTNEDRTATGRPRGDLIGAREARALVKCGDTTMRAMLAAGFGPPAFKTPRLESLAVLGGLAGC